MALLGAQLVITLIMISIIQKVAPYVSFARWLLCGTGLTRYLHPSDAELRQLAKIPKVTAKGKAAKKLKAQLENGAASANSFLVPKNLEISLETTRVIHSDAALLRFYMEYQWFLDFTLYSLLVYSVTEFYQIWFPINDEINLSIVWLLLVLLFGLKLMWSLTVQYFQSDESGERSTCIVMGFCYFLLSMVVIIVDENILEIGLNSAYDTFNAKAMDFLEKQGLNSTGPASKIVLNFFIAIICGILGGFFTFPGLRVARMHWDLLKYYRDRRIMQFLLNVAFAMPFFLVVLWIRPVARVYFTIRVFSGMSGPLISDNVFDTLRIVATVVMITLKIILMPWYLQAYLNMAYDRIEEQKKEAGRITNIKFKQKIAVVFYYLCAVTLQYLVPLILCLTVVLMYKTLGEYHWGALFFKNLDVCPAETVLKLPTIDPFSTSDNSSNGDDSGSIKSTAMEIHLALESLKSVFTVTVFRGLFGFFTWWCCFLYFATTSIGLIYQTYFSVNY